MRHKKKRATQLAPWPQKRSLMIRNLITSLVIHGTITTTSKRAQALQAEADAFFSRLTRCYDKYEESDVRREIIRRIKDVVMTDEAWIKLIEIFIPKRNTEGKRFGYVQSLKLWNRAWDNAEKVLVRMQ